MAVYGLCRHRFSMGGPVANASDALETKKNREKTNRVHTPDDDSLTHAQTHPLLSRLIQMFACGVGSPT